MKVLFVSGYGLNSTNANAECFYKIIKSMKEYDEIEADVIGDSIFDEESKKNWKNSPTILLARLAHWPVVQPEAANRCYQYLQGKNLEQYDCIIVPHKPYEAVYAASRVKKNNPHIKLFIYALDPIANEIDANNGVGKHLFLLTKRAEKRAFEIADHVFHMECNRNKYSGSYYSKFLNKFSFLDFPLIDYENEEESEIKEQTSQIILLYSGTLDNTYRSPQYLMELYDAVSKKVDVQIHFYSKGNSVLDIERMSEKNKTIKSFGYVQKKELENRIEHADFLVNIGNKFSDMLPSKLLAYCMTGKPIIHIQNQKKDACISYLERYGLYLVVDENDPIETNTIKLIDFLQSNRGKRLSPKHIKSIFEHNTPEWNSEQIMKVLMGEGKSVGGVEKGSINTESRRDR